LAEGISHCPQQDRAITAEIYDSGLTGRPCDSAGKRSDTMTVAVPVSLLPLPSCRRSR
jgi:hypothetical protein